jgi:hypothetical protein
MLSIANTRNKPKKSLNHRPHIFMPIILTELASKMSAAQAQKAFSD